MGAKKKKRVYAKNTEYFVSWMNDTLKDKRCKETLKYSKMNITAKCDSIFNGNIQKNAIER